MTTDPDRTTRYHCEQAWLPDARVASNVLIQVRAGRIVGVSERATADRGVSTGLGIATSDVELRGLVLPGFANGHSHAFHRALRGRTHDARDTFWGWREQMYELAAVLEPDTYLPLARAVFAEMALAGFTSVGEFHYLHHRPDGTPYADSNAMAHVLIEAARDAGLRIAVLDACYLAGGISEPVVGAQVRFSDRTVDAWAERASALHAAYAPADDVVIGAAVHSVRAVPREDLPVIGAWSTARSAPLHAHLSEQPAENGACLEAYGRTPTALMDEAGLLGPRSTMVHATHLSEADITALGSSGTHVCLCPTTERDLADGVGPARRLVDAGAAMTFGSDSHAVIDAFEEARAAEMDLRLVTGERGHLGVDELLAGLTQLGHASLGFPDAGRLEVGARADLVAVDLTSVRTAGGADAPASAVVFAATAADVTDVVAGGRRVVRDGMHTIGDIGEALESAIGGLS